jgi:predicted Zn-dependent protease
MSRTSETPSRHFRVASPAVLGAVAALLAGCATTGTTPPAAAPTTPAATAAAPAAPGASAPAARPGGAAAANAAARPPAPGTPPAFAEVTKDAKRADGYLPLWTKDDKTWLEIPAALLDKPLFFGNSLASGLGERGFWPGMMGGEQLVVFRRQGNNVQMVARNYRVRAPAGTPLARAVEESYSDSLLAAVPLAAAPHADSKALLVDAQALLGGDLVGIQTALEASYRLPYSLDRSNSSIERARTTAEGTSITMRSHFAVPKLPAPPVLSPGAPPPNPAALPNPPQGVPDGRSFFLSQTYTLAPLPEVPAKTRAADLRVGYFTSGYIDFGDDTSEGRRRHNIERWRLEKKDPAAEVSEPKQPIRVVMDRNIPEKWRDAVKAGILEWNKAFEKAGFRNAVVVEQQADNADWTSLEGTRILAVRWFAIDGPGATAVGPSQSDPRSGEILRGAAIIPENWVRFFRNQSGDTEPRLNTAEAVQAAAMQAPGSFAKRLMTCDYATDALEQAQFAVELLSARGAFVPGSPEAEKYIKDSLTDVTMHEVGHALGLRHNFKASTGIKPAQLRDKGFTSTNGISNSVMDYNALNIPLDGEPVADYHMRGLGAYDYWAIEYGYREFSPETEKAALARIAAMAETNPALAYATDEDNIGAMDPMVNQRDLGDDPLAFAQRQMKLARELWARTQKRELAADDDFTIYRRNLQRGLNSFNASVPIAGKYVGGLYTNRTLAGSGKPLLVPVPAGQQRAALDLILAEVLSSDSFRFDPKFMSRLGVDQFDRLQPGRFMFNTDFSLAGAVLAIQRNVLDGLMGDGLAARLADAEVKVEDPKALMSYADVQQRLSGAVWAELKAPAKGGVREIDSLRRNLQREHVRRLASGVLRASSPAAADVRAVHRQAALALESQLKAAVAAGGWTTIARAHLADSLATLSEALKAPLAKQGV